MCMYDYGDGWAVHAERMHRARLSHRCDECGRRIEPGEDYELNSGILNGDKKWTSSKTCAHCLIARKWLGVICGGWLYCGIHEDIHQHVVDDAPESCFALMLVDVAMGKRWRDKQGNLHTLAYVRRLTKYAIKFGLERIERATAA